MSAVDPSVASTIPLFSSFFRTSRGLIYDAIPHARTLSERPPEAHCGFISIDLMARQVPTYRATRVPESGQGTLAGRIVRG